MVEGKSVEGTESGGTLCGGLPGKSGRCQGADCSLQGFLLRFCVH